MACRRDIFTWLLVLCMAGVTSGVARSVHERVAHADRAHAVLESSLHDHSHSGDSHADHAPTSDDDHDHSSGRHHACATCLMLTVGGKLNLPPPTPGVLSLPSDVSVAVVFRSSPLGISSPFAPSTPTCGPPIL